MRPTHERQPLFPKHGLKCSPGECADGLVQHTRPRVRGRCCAMARFQAAGQRSWAGPVAGVVRSGDRIEAQSDGRGRTTKRRNQDVEDEQGKEEEEEHGLLIRLRRRIEGRRGCGVWSTLLTALGGQRVGKHDASITEHLSQGIRIILKKPTGGCNFPLYLYTSTRASSKKHVDSQREPWPKRRRTWFGNRWIARKWTSALESWRGEASMGVLEERDDELRTLGPWDTGEIHPLVKHLVAGRELQAAAAAAGPAGAPRSSQLGPPPVLLPWRRPALH
ncbi:hypothetical protein GQ607_016842, partial [Colletotrichum asianum]